MGWCFADDERTSDLPSYTAKNAISTFLPTAHSRPSSMLACVERAGVPVSRHSEETRERNHFRPEAYDHGRLLRMSVRWSESNQMDLASFFPRGQVRGNSVKRNTCPSRRTSDVSVPW